MQYVNDAVYAVEGANAASGVKLTFVPTTVLVPATSPSGPAIVSAAEGSSALNVNSTVSKI